jgi:hypothetical protein
MKRSGFKMRSGNGPLAFKMMGSKVEKTDERGATDEEINNMMNH